MGRFFSLFLLTVLSHLGLTGQQAEQHFQVRPLAEGVYACIHKFGGEAICNAGVVDLGDFTLVIDPFMTPAAALNLVNWIEKTGLPPVRYVVNTHYHNDHVRGNQVFNGDVTIISTQRTADLIKLEEPKALAAESNYAPPLCKQFTQFRHEFTGDTLAKDFQVLKMMQPYFCALSRSATEIKTRIPDKLFTGMMLLDGNRKVQLLEMGEGHTPSDLVVYLPDEKILFGADLLTNEFHPYIPDGNAQGWLSILDDVSKLDILQLVPGHGNPGGKELIDVTRSYIQDVQDLARRQMGVEGEASSSQADIPMPDKYKDWWLGNFFSQNIRFLVESEKAKK